MQAESKFGTPQSNTAEIRWYEFHRWLNPFRVERATITTRLAPQEVRDRLRPHLYDIPWRPIGSESRQFGVLEDADKIAMRQRDRGRRSLHVEFVGDSSGTSLRLELRRSRLDTFLVTLLFLWILWTTLAILQTSGTSQLATLATWLGTLGYVGFAYFGYHWKHRNALDQYREFFHEVVPAAE